MAVKVYVPAPMQKLTQDRGEVEATGATVAELIGDLERTYPGVRNLVCDEAGHVRRFLNVYVNDKDIRFLDQENTRIRDGDEVAIIPAIAGGAGAAAPFAPQGEVNGAVAGRTTCRRRP